jgi:hypothetical protein
MLENERFFPEIIRVELDIQILMYQDTGLVEI